MKLTLAIGVAVALAVAACEPNYAYLPVTNATVVRGRVAADYPIPADMPHGDVRVASYGIVDIGPRHPKNKSDELRALHLRFTITNNGERDWSFDTREQRVALQGWGTSAAAFVSGSAGSAPPVVVVPALGERVVDLFFPLPAPLQRAKELPAFDVIWRMRADNRWVARRTPFERVVVTPPPDYGPYEYGAEGPEAVFVGGVTVPRRYYYGGHVGIHRDVNEPRFLERGSPNQGAPAQPRAR